ncbi:MAG: S1C family serine protease, partial [Clostridiales bacterium]|nr:S1C family serine protease [Clostridiales bacterium]
AGNSGGALIDMGGKLVGVNTYKAVREATDETEIDNIGYANPSNMALAVYHNIINNLNKNTPVNSLRKPEFGITVKVMPETADSFDKPYLVVDKTGLSSTITWSAVNGGRFQSGDRIIAIGGASLFDGDGNYIYQKNALPSIAPLEQISLYYGAKKESDVKLTVTIRRTVLFAAQEITLTFNELYLQREIPFLA